MSIAKCYACGKLVSNEAKKCPCCGAEPKEGLSVIHVVGIVVFGLIVIAFSTLKPEVKPEDKSILAYIQCQGFVKDRLKAPATAEFSYSDFTSSALVDNQLTIKSYVDAQNSFGAKLRNNFLCTVKWNEANSANAGSWELVSIQMDEL